MSIKEFLAEGNKDFISLYDLLKELEKQQNVSHQEAAAYLYRLAGIVDLPTLYSFSIGGGKRIEYNEDAYHYIRLAAQDELQTDFFGICLLNAKNFGFSASEMMEFLVTHGINIDLNEYTQSVLSKRKRQAEKEETGLQENSEAKQKQENNIETLVSENENLKRELERLKAEQLQGKNRTSIMKLIAALAVQGYKAELSNGRIANIGEIVADSQKNGTPLDEKTVRNILNEALKLNE